MRIFFFSYFTPFLQFHTFFHTFFNFFFCHCTTTLSYQSIKKKVSLYLSRFSNFAWVQVCDIIWTHARTHAQTNFWITIPRVSLKVLELKSIIPLVFNLIKRNQRYHLQSHSTIWFSCYKLISYKSCVRYYNRSKILGGDKVPQANKLHIFVTLNYS